MPKKISFELIILLMVTLVVAFKLSSLVVLHKELKKALLQFRVQF
jgi:hypothetical protein